MAQIPIFDESTEGLKRYYSIAEVADMFGISKSQIRYWEKEFTFFMPHKSSKGVRLFTRENLEQLQVIYHLVKERGFTLEGAKKELVRQQKQVQSIQPVITRLEQVKKFLLEIKEELDKR